jgi:SAM-dependent methyltransferase
MASPITTYLHAYSVAPSMPAVEGVMYAAGWWTPHSDDWSRAAPGADSTAPVLDLTPIQVAADRDDVFAVMLSKIPAGVTRVLDIGCGNGDFAKTLHASRPGVNYRGMDLSMEAVAVATTNLQTSPGNLPANVELVVGNVTEYLLEATEDWDFIISSRCMFAETDRPGDRDLLRLIDSKAAKGWFIYGLQRRLVRPDLQYVMQEALTKSTNPTEHYFKGARGWLVGHSTTGTFPCHPCYIARDGSLMEAPPQKQFDRYARIKNGQYEEDRVKATLRHNPDMTEYKGITTDGNGLITGEATVPKANAPAGADLAAFEQKQIAQKTFNKIKG